VSGQGRSAVDVIGRKTGAKAEIKRAEWAVLPRRSRSGIVGRESTSAADIERGGKVILGRPGGRGRGEQQKLARAGTAAAWCAPAFRSLAARE
jgi:hypothetical protein